MDCEFGQLDFACLDRIQVSMLGERKLFMKLGASTNGFAFCGLLVSASVDDSAKSKELKVNIFINHSHHEVSQPTL